MKARAMNAEYMIQITETFQVALHAQEALSGLERQDGYVGGRLIEPSAEKPGWRIQVFFQDEPEAAEFADHLPDGVRRVLVMDSTRKTLGIPELEPGYRTRQLTIALRDALEPEAKFIEVLEPWKVYPLDSKEVGWVEVGEGNWEQGFNLATYDQIHFCSFGTFVVLPGTGKVFAIARPGEEYDPPGRHRFISQDAATKVEYPKIQVIEPEVTSAALIKKRDDLREEIKGLEYKCPRVGTEMSTDLDRFRGRLEEIEVELDRRELALPA